MKMKIASYIFFLIGTLNLNVNFKNHPRKTRCNDPEFQDMQCDSKGAANLNSG